MFYVEDRKKRKYRDILHLLYFYKVQNQIIYPQTIYCQVDISFVQINGNQGDSALNQ